MTPTPWSPADADVEAAAKKIDTLSTVDLDCGGIANAKSVAYAVMQDLHARGWRDAEEVAAIEKERDDATFALTTAKLGWLIGAMPVRPDIHNAVCRRLEAMTADRDALAARVKELTREWESAIERDKVTEHLRQEAEARAARLAALLLDARQFVDMAAQSQRRFLDRLANPPDDLKTGCADLFSKLERIDAALAADTAEKEKA